MSFVIVGTNHKYSPIALRERLSFSKKRLKSSLSFLKERGIIKAAVILSTCNRVEIYASAEDSKTAIVEIQEFISRYHEINKLTVSPYLYIYEGREAARHLFSVACGLDSLVLGEVQILGQVKFALSESENANFMDGYLKEIFYSAISFAKRIHQDTGISEGKTSVGSVAIDFIKEKIGNLSDKNILIIGVGKVTELVLKYLKKENPNVVFVSNRTFQKAKDLAAQISAKAVRFDELNRYLREADVVISATASPHYIVKKEMLEKAISYQLSAISRKLLIIDLALPRDVDPRVKGIKDVDLFGLEDLDTVIRKNIEKKAQEAKRVKGIIDIEVERLWPKFIGLEREEVRLP